MIRKLYPHGKRKAFNVTYDDGILQDIRFVELLNKYGLKGTFNLNSDLMKREFEWVHESGLTIRRLSVEKAQKIYKGHEIASHTLTHPYLTQLTEEELLYELQTDRRNLENLFHREVAGFAVPFDYYSDLIEACVGRSGFEYARISAQSGFYVPEKNYFRWRAGLFHLDPKLDDYVNGFLETEEELAVCQIAGHSYDLDTEQLWEKMEAVFQKISSYEEILPVTNIELVRYLKAMRSAVITDCEIKNISGIPLWFQTDGIVISVMPGGNISTELDMRMTAGSIIQAVQGTM